MLLFKVNLVLYFVVININYQPYLVKFNLYHIFFYISASKNLLTKKKTMAYKHTNERGTTYYLHKQDVTLKSTGNVQTIYFFAKEELTVSKKGNPVTCLDALPDGKMVKENSRTGLPFVKKK